MGNSMGSERLRRLVVVGAGLIGLAGAAAGGWRLSPQGRALAHYRAGVAGAHCGHASEEATAHLKDALRLDPRLFIARQALANTYAESGKAGDAGRLYEEAIWTDPTDPRPHRELADLALPGDHAAAARHLEACLALREDDREAWYLLAFCYERQGRFGEALRVWEDVAKRWQGDDRAVKALPRLRSKAREEADTKATASSDPVTAKEFIRSPICPSCVPTGGSGDGPCKEIERTSWPRGDKQSKKAPAGAGGSTSDRGSPSR
jgi:tetratricopeptide (TPR) repeat protein